MTSTTRRLRLLDQITVAHTLNANEWGSTRAAKAFNGVVKSLEEMGTDTTAIGEQNPKATTCELLRAYAKHVTSFILYRMEQEDRDAQGA